MAVQLTRRRFTTEEYHRLGEIGILGEDDRVELIEGEILQMSPIGHKHIGGVNRLNHLFTRLVGAAAVVSVQNPVQLEDGSEPEPDLTLLRPRADYYASALPTAADVLLIVEIADSSIEYDRQIKAPLYARNGIPELWILDLGRDHLTVHQEPTSTSYQTTRVLRRGDTIRPVAFAELEITLDEILGASE